MENKWKNKNFFAALKNALNGIKYVLKTGQNIKIQLLIAIFVIICGIFLKINITEWLVLILTIFIVLIAEFINSAIEKTIDMITIEYNENAKIVKDIAAGSVTLAAICSMIIGIIIFLPKVLDIILR